MKLFRWNIEVTRRPTPEVTQQKGFDPEAWLRGDDIGGGIALSNAYQQVVWVYRAVNALAEQLANIPFLFSAGERGRENLITSGPLLDFYARPHSQLNRFQYWELRVIWLMLRGECMRVPIWESSSVPSSSSSFSSSPFHSCPAHRPRLRSVLLLDPSRFQHIVEDHQLIGWRYNGLGPQTPLASQVFLPEEVWFEKLPNPFDFWRGFPPLYAAGMAAETDFAAGAFMRGVIENNADNGVIVRSQNPLGDEQQEQIIAALRERKRKAGTADRPVFLNGVTEIVQPRLSSSDLQFLDNRKFSRAEICAAFGVPEEVVTTTEHAKYDVMAGARLNFIENRVAPLCSRLEAEEEATVRSIDPRASGWFDLDSLPILQEARRQRLTAARTGFEMGVPFNELNRVLDLGFKPLAWGDRGYVGSKLQEVGNGGCNALTRPETQWVKAMRRQLPRGEPETADAMIRAEALLNGLENGDTSALYRQLLSKLQRFNFEQRGRVLGKLAEQLDGTSGGGQLRPDLLLEVPAENRRLTERLQPVLGQATGTSAEDISKAINGLNQARLEQLREASAQAFAAGEGREQIVARVKAIYNQEPTRIAEMVTFIETIVAAAR